MQVPFFKQPKHGAEHEEKLRRAVEKTIHEGQFILGPEVAEFEQEFARYCEAPHCVGVSNGCEALYLVLQALGIGSGDEIIVPANTFIGTVLPILRVGATPVFVDCSAIDSNIDPALIKAAVTSRTKAIVPVHLYGRPAALDKILPIANDRGLIVIEDAAQAHGARLQDVRCGSLAHYSTFSFYPAKNLGAYGDAGAVITKDAELAAQIQSLRNYGQSKKYHHDFEGWNSRLDTLQAAVLSVKLSRLDAENAARRRCADLYREGLQGLPLRWPVDRADTESVYHLFVVMTERRDALMAHLNSNGIQTGIHYPIPCHRQLCFADRVPANASFPETERQARELLSLPMHAGLMPTEIDYVTANIRDFFNSKA